MVNTALWVGLFDHLSAEGFFTRADRSVRSTRAVAETYNNRHNFDPAAQTALLVMFFAIGYFLLLANGIKELAPYSFLVKPVAFTPVTWVIIAIATALLIGMALHGFLNRTKISS